MDLAPDPMEASDLADLSGAGEAMGGRLDSPLFCSGGSGNAVVAAGPRLGGGGIAAEESRSRGELRSLLRGAAMAAGDGDAAGIGAGKGPGAAAVRLPPPSLLLTLGRFATSAVSIAPAAVPEQSAIGLLFSPVAAAAAAEAAREASSSRRGTFGEPDEAAAAPGSPPAADFGRLCGG